MGVAYDETGSALIESSERGIWKAGRRCPDIELLRTESSDAARLYSTIAYGQFSILSIGDSLKHDWPQYHVALARYTILSGNQEGSSRDGLSFTSPDVQPDERLVVVVRPDTYIGYVGTEQGAISYLSKVLGST